MWRSSMDQAGFCWLEGPQEATGSGSEPSGQPEAIGSGEVCGAPGAQACLQGNHFSALAVLLGRTTGPRCSELICQEKLKI